MLQTNTTMQVLSLNTQYKANGPNPIIRRLGHESACAITEGLYANNTLEKLDLGGCLDADRSMGLLGRRCLVKKTPHGRSLYLQNVVSLMVLLESKVSARDWPRIDPCGSWTSARTGWTLPPSSRCQ
jgi:hypothetical protein